MSDHQPGPLAVVIPRVTGALGELRRNTSTFLCFPFAVPFSSCISCLVTKLKGKLHLSEECPYFG